MPTPAAPETVVAYIAECAGRLKVGSIQRRLNEIAEAHKAVGVDVPVFRAISRHGHVQLGRLSGIDVARVVKKLAERALAATSSWI